MSSSVVSNYLFGLISDIEDVYVDYSKKNPDASYEDFYKYLDGTTVDKEREGLKLSITLKLLEICYKIDLLKRNETDLNDKRQDSLTRIKAAIILVYVVLTIVFVVVMVLVAKAYKNDVVSAGKMILTIIIIYLIISTVFILFMMLINNQKKIVKRAKDDNVNAINRFLKFMHDGEVKMSMDPDKHMKTFVAFRNDRKKPKPKQTDTTFTSAEWSRYTSLVIKNVHNRGNGLRTLKIVETTSSNIKVLKGVNEALGPYYDLMLKSRQVFSDTNTKEGIMKVLDATVIKELNSIDVFNLDHTKTMKDSEFINNLQTGDNYMMMMRGFKHLMVYLYPVYKNVSYKKLLQLQKDEEALKATGKTQDTSTLNDADKDSLNQAMLEDPILIEVRKSYPLARENFSDELVLMKRYDEVDSTKSKVQLVSDFINDTVSTFNDINDTENDKYLVLMNKTPSPSDTRLLMADYAKTFNAYFEKLYKNLIDNELAPLNPTSGQYFVFNPRYMEDALKTEIDSSTLLNRLEPEFTKMMTDIILKDIIAEQKRRFVTAYFAFDTDKNKNLKSLQTNNRIAALVQRVSLNLAAYNFKVTDYAKYIIGKLSEMGAGNISSAVQGAIETILADIDHEVGIQKALVSKSLQDMSQELRFVPIQDFVYNLDQYKLNTLISALNPDYMKQIVDTINPDGSKVFAGREFNVNLANTLKIMITTIIVPSYLLYVLWMLGKINMNWNVFKDDKSQLNSLLQGDPLWGNVFKFGMPLASSFLFIAIFNSYVVKAKNNIDFNKEIMRDNTEQIKQSVNELNSILSTLGAKVPIDKASSSIGDIEEFDTETKQKLYKAIKNILITYDKCNYIIGIDKYELPFPYAEVLTDGVMVVLLLSLIGYTLNKFAPFARMIELKDLYEYKETSSTLVNDSSFISEIMAKFACHKNDVDGIMFAVKAMASLSVLIFMILYSLKITTATSEYKGGLYSSGLYENKNCAA